MINLVTYLGGVYKHPRKTRQQWESSDEVLESGTIGIETDTRKLKVGDGVRRWRDLLYINTDSTDHFKDKNIVTFGDSIIETKDPSVADIIELNLGANVYNVGFGGCMMANHPNTNFSKFSMCNLTDAVVSGNFSQQQSAITASEIPNRFGEALNTLKGIDFTTVDIITISYGTNDFANSNKIDNSSNIYDKATYLGALRHSVRALLHKFPQLKILVTVPIFRSTNDRTENIYNWRNGNGERIIEFRDALVTKFNREMGIPVADTLFELGINQFNEIYYFSETDGTHPNEEGRKLIGNKISNEVIRHYAGVIGEIIPIDQGELPPGVPEPEEPADGEVVFDSRQNNVVFERNPQNIYLDSFEVTLSPVTEYIFETNYPADLWLSDNAYAPQQHKFTGGSFRLTTNVNGSFVIIGRPAVDPDGSTYSTNVDQFASGQYYFVIKES